MFFEQDYLRFQRPHRLENHSLDYSGNALRLGGVIVRIISPDLCIGPKSKIEQKERVRWEKSLLSILKSASGAKVA